MTRSSDLSRVCLAISSFRNDDAVLRLLESVQRSGLAFASTLVVDSLGTGEIPRAIAERGWRDVRYVSANENLGSAGNLARRLRLAAETSADWVYALNHDGELDGGIISSLLCTSEQQQSERWGALYPLRRMTNRQDAFDVTGRYRVPLRSVRIAKPPTQRLIDVYWSSSNGALYALAPVRAGLYPDAELWMGFEDLGYGWLLANHGYRQVIVSEVIANDNYEYGRRAKLWLTRKPSWYAYYYARNLLLVAARTRQPLAVRALIAARVAAEFLVTGALRADKLRRLEFLAHGVADGLRNKSGKWRLP